MKVADVRDLFVYNAWAARRMFDALAALPTEQYERDMKCSFGNIHGTLAHIVGAEQLWLGRWLGRPATMLKSGDVGSQAELRKIWDVVEAERASYLGRLTDAALDGTIAVKASSGGEYVHTLRETLLHTVDHSSYHRGQIVTLLRQQGVKPPNTGLIGFYRERRAAGAGH